MRHQHKTKSYVALFIVCLLLICSVIIPIPYYIQMPGSAEDVQQFVKIDGKSNDQTGAYLLTTVGVRQATLASFLLAKTSDFKEVESKKEMFGESSSQEYDEITDLQMTSSENMAKKVALDLAKEPYKLVYEGVFVHSVAENSDFNGKLKVGDIVYQVDKTAFKSSEEFTTYVKSKKLNDKVTLSIERNGKKEEVSGKLVELKETKNVGIGITLSDKTELESEKNITFDVEGIGGPSAGLMFTLEIYEGLTKQSLRKGHVIAGTGEIRSNGDVGMIGGIDKKVVAADKAGADIFFAPSEEYSKETLKEYPDLKNNFTVAKEAAKKIKTKMKIVPVENVQNALDYMEKLSEKKQ